MEEYAISITVVIKKCISNVGGEGIDWKGIYWLY